jgi:hypothetical protein
MIEQADIFQLFWSSNSMLSPFVRQEWEHALRLNRPHFIRPTYWEEPMPMAPEKDLPPEALRRLHFQRIFAPLQTHPILQPAGVEGSFGEETRSEAAPPLVRELWATRAPGGAGVPPPPPAAPTPAAVPPVRTRGARDQREYEATPQVPPGRAEIRPRPKASLRWLPVGLLLILVGAAGLLALYWYFFLR